jgi:hypothetical protein
VFVLLGKTVRRGGVEEGQVAAAHEGNTPFGLCGADEGGNG